MVSTHPGLHLQTDLGNGTKSAIMLSGLGADGRHAPEWLGWEKPGGVSAD